MVNKEADRFLELVDNLYEVWIPRKQLLLKLRMLQAKTIKLVVIRRLVFQFLMREAVPVLERQGVIIPCNRLLHKVTARLTTLELKRLRKGYYDDSLLI